MRSPLRAGVAAPRAMAFFAAGFFAAPFFAAGFIFATGFVAAAEVFFPAGFAFFFGCTVDLLSSRGCRGGGPTLLREAGSQTAGPDARVTVAVCWPCWSSQGPWSCAPGA